MEKWYYKFICDEKPEIIIKGKKGIANESRNHIHRKTNANTRDHSIFIKSWMCPFPPKYLFCVLLITDIAVITADKCGSPQT